MIRVGVGGWTFAPWRGLFYPDGLPQARELNYAASRLTSIEINGTFYRSQKPETFRKWAQETPDDFIFAVKAPRYATSRKRLAEAGEVIERFIDGGLTQLGAKLGPINWQLPPAKKFEPDDVGAFLAMLPREADGAPLRHCLEVRHESFTAPEFASLAAEHGVAIILADSDVYPAIADKGEGLVYARLMMSSEREKHGYAPEKLKGWAERALRWESEGRDVFLYFISGFKPRAPAAALAMLEALKPAASKRS